ncbi:MAG: DUF4097 family beta strand repeat-containing protein [Anaerohalosphaeraceae bacterium]
MKKPGAFGIIASLLLVSGCIIICNSCDTPPHKAENTVTVSREMGTNLLLDAETGNGNISVQGQDTNTCTVIAHITARGNTQEEAQSLADGTQIVLDLSDMGMIVAIKKPDSELAKHISVSFDITMPNQNKLNLITSNGNIQVIAVSQKIDLGTSNGNITLTDTAGPVNARTSNGTIRCMNTQNDIHAHSSNGDIEITFDKTAAASIIDLETSNGSITLTPGENFSAKIDASTSNGKVTSDRPITVQGELSKASIRGTIGDGQGDCRLHTSNGSIRIH